MVGVIGAMVGTLGSVAWFYTAIESFGAGIFWLFLIACFGFVVTLRLTRDLIIGEL